MIGFFTGGAFAGYLTFAHRSRRIADISTPRVAFAGAVVGGLLSPGMAGLAAVLGASSAAASVAIAKRGSRLEAPTSPDLIESSHPDFIE